MITHFNRKSVKKQSHS